jgi:hypothetical protein
MIKQNNGEETHTHKRGKNNCKYICMYLCANGNGRCVAEQYSLMASHGTHEHILICRKGVTEYM